MDVIVQQIENYLKRVITTPSVIWVAYSGGLDSHVLLHALCSLRKKFPIKLQALHVNHHLQAESSAWAKHCQVQCQNLNIACTILDVDARAASRQSPENAARQARYQALFETISGDDILVTAHHQSDQAETLMLQLLRGAGLSGLAAMPEVKQTQLRHHRPLLSCTHKAVVAYAEKFQLDYIDDPSNQDTSIRRNFIRHEILPKLLDTWPQAMGSLAKSAEYLADALRLQESLLDSLLSGLLITPDCLNLTNLLQLPNIQQRHCLRHWYQSLGLPRPATSLLDRIVADVINARTDAQPRFQFAGSQLLRSQDKLLLLPDWNLPDVTTVQVHNTKIIECDAFQLRLSVDDHFVKQPVSVVLGSYAVKIDYRGQKRALKKFYKELAIPEVLRLMLPLVFVADELVLIPGLFEHGSQKGINYEFAMSRLIDSEQSVISEIFR